MLSSQLRVILGGETQYTTYWTVLRHSSSAAPVPLCRHREGSQVLSGRAARHKTSESHCRQCWPCKMLAKHVARNTLHFRGGAGLPSLTKFPSPGYHRVFLNRYFRPEGWRQTVISKILLVSWSRVAWLALTSTGCTPEALRYMGQKRDIREPPRAFFREEAGGDVELPLY